MYLLSRIILVVLLVFSPLHLRAQNIALGRNATASAALWSSLPLTNINDGNVSTFTHPLAASGTTGFTYEIDLGSEQALHHISVVNRGDGCCPERLTNYRISLHSDNGGAAGAVLWQADVRTNGTNSGIGGTDVLYANASTNPAHTFRGRFLRLINLSGAAYNPQVAEIQAWVVSANTNVALGRPVIASGAVYPGMTPGRLTDGVILGTPAIVHPADGATLGFYYQTDLGAEYTLNRILLYNRSDCCPERLTNYRVTLYADNAGTPGAILWQAGIRTDGTNSGSGGVDTITKTASTNPAHVFKGRFIRVENLSGAAYNPQIAELEVYPEPPPTIRHFLTDAGNISGAGLPSSAVLSWLVENADTVSISGGVGNVALSGTATVAPSGFTTYTLTATRAGASNATATVVIAVNAAVQQPVISEFQAADGLLEDEDGDRPDWIELRNLNNYTLNLANHALTDDPAVPAKWTFPLANIPPGGRIVVHASGKDRRVIGSPLHTNFSLTASGEYLALRSPANGLIQQFPADYPTTLVYPKQYDRVSYGLDGGGLAKYFKPATPGGPNGASYNGVVADTNFSVKRGIYSSPQTISITTTTPGATIRYTTTSAEPTETTGAVYTGPLTIATTTTLRVAAFAPGFVPTNTDTNTYVFPADVVTQPGMSTSITTHPTYGPQMIAALTDLPSISIVTPATIVDGMSALCSFEYIPTSGTGVQENAGVENFGGAFTNFAKKSFRVSFNAEFGATKLSVPELFTSHARGLKPVGKFDQLELRNGSHDMALRGFYMSNIFTDGTMLDMGGLAPHSRFVHLYLNGSYHGMYQLRERWSAAQQSAYLGGPSGAYEAINGNWNVGGWAEPGTAYDGDGTAWQNAKTFRANYAGIRPFVDVKHYVDYMLMFMFGNSEDEYRAVSPKAAGSGFKFLLNDADGFLATQSYMGSVPANRVALRSNPNPGRQNGDGPGSILSQLWQQGDADYKTLLADRIHSHLFNGGALTPSANTARLTAMCNEIQRAFYAESARWVASGQSRTPDTWATDRNYILNTWFPSRSSAYLGYLQSAGYYPTTSAPAFGGGVVAAGTNVSFPVAGATVYFTTDGSDPRLPGGGVNPAATTAASTTINVNTWLRARARIGSTWSALNEAFHTVTAPLLPGDVVFSEIHYNPQGDDDSEFIEVWNPTNRAINLRGAKFTAGLSYDFPENRDVPLAPGGRLLLVSSQYSFQLRYGINIPIAGVYFDRLGNDGDTLTLATSAGTQLISLNYQDLAPWPDSADGEGYSLVLSDSAQPTAASSWRTSLAANGTPGSGDAIAAFTGSALADADADGIPALIEHFLAGSDSVRNASPLAATRTPDGRLALTFPRRLGADDLTYTVEASNDLVTWTVPVSRTAHINNGNGTANETWTAVAPAAAQFMRLRVVKP